MFQVPCLKILTVILLFILIVYELGQIHEEQSSLICKETARRNNKQGLYLSPSSSYVLHQYFFNGATSILEVYQHLVDLSYAQSKFIKYVDSLSVSQVAGVIKKFGVDNLTTRKSQNKFLKCTGITLLRKLHRKMPECEHLSSSLNIPPSSQQCKNMSFQSSGPVVALASYPGSGNSWVRQLLESATGIYTGAVYCDPSYINAGMMGEGIDTENVIAIKAHHGPSFIKKLLNNDKAIYIVRSPFEAILAEHTRSIASSSKKYASLGNSHTVEINYKYGK